MTPRVLHVLPCLNRGGAEFAVLRMVEALAGRYRFAMLAPDGPGQGLFDGVLPRRAFRRIEADLPTAAASLRRALAAEAADPPAIVHVHTEAALLWFAARALPGAARVYTNHGIVGAARIKAAATAWAANRWAHRTTVVSAHDRDRMLDAGADPARLVLVPNGVARPTADPAAAAALRARIGGDGPVAVALARLEPEKGVDVLIRAAALAARAMPGLRVCVGGEGGQRARLERLIAATGAPVALPGFLPAGALMAAADLYVQPSRAEAFGMAAAEAMAAGLPVIASRTGGLPEVVDDGATGLLVPPDDPAALAAAILRLAGDPALRLRMGQAGAAVQARRFSLPVLAGGVAAVYDAALSAAR